MRFVLVPLAVLLLAGCAADRRKIEALEKQLKDSQATIVAYQDRFGTLPDRKERKDVHALQDSLTGKGGPGIYAQLGQPQSVFTLNGREAWTYKDAAYDADTGRNVGYLEFWLRDGIVEEIDFTY